MVQKIKIFKSRTSNFKFQFVNLKSISNFKYSNLKFEIEDLRLKVNMRFEIKDSDFGFRIV